MEQINKPKKKKWPLILFGIVLVGAILSQIEYTIAIPKCCGLYWKSTSCCGNKKVK